MIGLDDAIAQRDAMHAARQGEPVLFLMTHDGFRDDTVDAHFIERRAAVDDGQQHRDPLARVQIERDLQRIARKADVGARRTRESGAHCGASVRRVRSSVSSVASGNVPRSCARAGATRQREQRRQQPARRGDAGRCRYSHDAPTRRDASRARAASQ